MPDTRDPSPAVAAQWRDGQTLVNLRGHAEDEAFMQACATALGMALPNTPCRTAAAASRRVVWAGPDDWFVVDPAVPAGRLVADLRAAVSGLNAAVTDVSSGYTVLRLSGHPARDVLAQGCPLDLHPRAFGPDDCAGSHFFKAAIWLWQADAGQPAFELLVRRSFKRYVTLMMERSMREYPTRDPAR